MTTLPHQTLVAGGCRSKQTNITGRDRIIAVAPSARLNTAVQSFGHDPLRSGIGEGDVISPRTAVSGQFERLGFGTTTMGRDATDQRRGRAQGDWDVYQDHGRRSQSPVVEETPEPVTSDDSINEMMQNTDATSRAQLPRPHVFQFKAGGKGGGSGMVEASFGSTSASSINSSFERSLRAGDGPSRSKRARLDVDEVPGTPTPSPEQKEEHGNTTPIVRYQSQEDRAPLSGASVEPETVDTSDTAMSEPSSAEPPPPPLRAQSPSARRLLMVGKTSGNSKKRASPSTDSSDDIFPDPSLWWQDSEITGYDPTDPEEDDRGVNGVGYQKTRVQAAKITQLRKKQIEEYRRREAREARASRAGGRRGREVRVKPAGESPTVVKAELQASNAPAEVVKEVRFEVG